MAPESPNPSLPLLPLRSDRQQGNPPTWGSRSLHHAIVVGLPCYLSVMGQMWLVMVGLSEAWDNVEGLGGEPRVTTKFPECPAK